MAIKVTKGQISNGTTSKNTCIEEYYLCGKFHGFMKNCTIFGCTAILLGRISYRHHNDIKERVINYHMTKYVQSDFDELISVTSFLDPRVKTKHLKDQDVIKQRVIENGVELIESGAGIDDHSLVAVVMSHLQVVEVMVVHQTNIAS